MIIVTKIFHFEMAHAIHGYQGACRYIHGHSYELHVALAAHDPAEYFPGTGFVFDFKDLKKLVNQEVIAQLDHKLLLSQEYLKTQHMVPDPPNLITWTSEPSAENLLIYIQRTLAKILPAHLTLSSLKLYETKDSYAEWFNDNARRNI